MRRASADWPVEHDAEELVVGLPLSLDGSEGPQATSTREWAAAVVPLTGLRVSWQDERHTSQEAERRIGSPARGRSGGPPSAIRHACLPRPRRP